jgi:hypothetical protein
LLMYLKSLIDKEDQWISMFPPFYANCGKNICVGIIPEIDDCVKKGTIS